MFNFTSELVRAARLVYSERREGEGLGVFFRGIETSLLLCSNPAIQFAAYERLRIRHLRKTGEQFPGPVDAFWMGAVAKAIATLFTYPLQVVQTRQRKGKGKKRKKNKKKRVAAAAGAGVEETKSADTEDDQTADDNSFQAVFLRLLRQEGLAGLYSGLSSKLLQTVLNAAFLFLVYEQILVAVTRVRKALSLATYRRKLKA